MGPGQADGLGPFVVGQLQTHQIDQNGGQGLGVWAIVGAHAGLCFGKQSDWETVGNFEPQLLRWVNLPKEKFREVVADMDLAGLQFWLLGGTHVYKRHKSAAHQSAGCRTVRLIRSDIGNRRPLLLSYASWPDGGRWCYPRNRSCAWMGRRAAFLE